VHPAWGYLLTEGRGDLPAQVLGGRSLLALATSALEQAGVTLAPGDLPWETVQESGAAVCLHDPLCPLTPAWFLAEAIATPAPVVVGCRPVTDTIKTVTGGVLGRTVDREALVCVTSPLVLSASVVAAQPVRPDASDIAALVSDLRDRFDVALLESPPAGRRVEDRSAVRLLEAAADGSL